MKFTSPPLRRRAVQAVERMTVRGQPVLEYQKKAQGDAACALDQIRARASLDADQTFARDPGLVAEAANGKTAATIRAMQLEAEMRTNPELRADRFVQSWQQLRAVRDTFSGGAQEEKRAALETRMAGLVKSLGKDPDLGAALSQRSAQMGLGPQWARQWSPGSSGGDIGQELSVKVRTQAVMEGLTETLGRERTMGLGL